MPASLNSSVPDTAPNRSGWSRDSGYWLYVALHLAGFAASTLLIVWGLFLLFFLMLGGLSIDGLMQQLANLADRYIAADAVRAASFNHILLVAHLLLAAAVAVLRRHAILRIRDPKWSHRHG